MAHWSENAKALRVKVLTCGAPKEMGNLAEPRPSVWVLVLPFARTLADAEASADFVSDVQAFAERLHPESVVAILTTPPDAAALFGRLGPVLHFQLWVAVKLAKPRRRDGQLPEHHAALLILTKYRSALRHTKTRISYTYCPACAKTTKDYGGKKHTYHEYGTVISDVWRDIHYDPPAFPEEVVCRLGDLFGMSPYDELNLVDLRSCAALQTSDASTSSGQAREESRVLELPSALVNGDCLESLEGIPDESVEFCFADPPYNLRKKYDSWSDTLDAREYFQWCDGWLTELARVLKPGRTCAVLNIPLWAIRHFLHLKNLLAYQAWVAWEGLSLPVRMIMPAHYSIVCFSKGQATPLPGLVRESHSSLEEEVLHPLAELYCLRADCTARRNFRKVIDRGPLTDLWWDIHRLKHNSRRVDHPCQLPPALMRRLISLFTSEGELVLDPFNGAGTTTLAAEQLGRRFIGIELSKAYHELATKRHEELRAGVDPFAKNKDVPKAKNSPVKRLPKQAYAVSKKQLQLEVKRIAQSLGHKPSREEVQRLSKFPITYFQDYFISWGEVCAAARTTGMTETNPHVAGSRRTRQLGLFQEK